MRPEDTPPHSAAIVTCSCCWKTYRYGGKQIARGTPALSTACGKRKGTATGAKSEGALLVAASVVAPASLRGQEIAPSPKLNAVVHDSILLARTILAHLK
jgi:hypothetical protein